jgi:unsaturated rhamnogalacturonyl hydrolase
MKIFLSIILFFTFGGSFLFSQKSIETWSTRIAQSFIALHPDSINYPDEEKSRKWNYEQGLMLEAFYQMWLHTNNEEYKTYLKKNLDYYIQDDGTIKTYTLTEYNMDNVAQGKAALRAYGLFHEKKYLLAAEVLRKQLASQPRTPEGGFWHKKIYPNQMWLDGLYMGEPFYTLFSIIMKDTAAFNDIANQFLLIAQHCKDPRTGLFFHGWDESKEQRWANKKTGCSPNLWGRSLGWYAMALVDVLDDFPLQNPKRKELVSIFQSLMENVLKQRDEKSKLWYQVIDKQGEQGNYLEASASAMFTYACAKGARKGYLDKNFSSAAEESFNGILKNLVAVDDHGRIFLHDVCRVSGLGGTPYRDGSYSYYISEPRRTNDFKGYGPFLLAAIELEKIQ